MSKLNAQKIEAEEVDNTKQVLITVTQDRLKLKLREYKEYYSSFTNWTIPLGICLSLSLSYFSSEYKDTFGLNKSVIEACVIICMIISGLWLIYAIIMSIKNYKKKDLDELINKIKSEQ
jgi:hypothetical protein